MDQLTQHDPRRIGPFEVLGRLGAGGMGLVYLARSASGRRVAIKTVRAELAEDQLFRVRFTREVEAARAVSGFYTAAVVDADPRAAVPWLATAYVPAPSLEEIVTRTGPLPPQAVRWLAAGVAEALQSIHGARLVHRDLKPSNVLVVEDGPRVIDFGIASGVSNTRLTMTNVAVGTPAYMSPEQAKDSRSVTGASDVFSLGSTLVFAATGHAPFRGANPVETVFMLLREGPNLAGLPDELRPLIQSCMRKEAADRPSPAELQAQLAPHLYASSDDTGTASAWLPPAALAMIDERNGRSSRPSAAPVGQPLPLAVPPMPLRPPLPPAEPMPEGPVQLANSVPIGPGPLVAEPKEPAFGEVTGATAPPAGLAWSQGSAPMSAAPVSAAPVSQPTAPYPAPLPRPQQAGPQQAGPQQAGPQQAESAQQTGPAGPQHAAAHGAMADEWWRPWRFRMSNDVWGTPVVAGNRLYVTSFEVHALDVATGQRQFKTSEVAWTMALDDGVIHASDGNRMFAFDALDGGPRGSITPGGWVYSMRAADGMLVAGVRGGGVEGYDVSRGTLAGKAWERFGAQTDFESAEAGPALIDGTVYFRGGGRLYALDARTGEERWWHALGDAEVTGGVPVPPAVVDGVVHLTVGSRVLALDAADGTERWRFDAPAVFFSPPTVMAGGVYVVDYLGTVYALSAHAGVERWRVATEARQSVEPLLVNDGLVHLGSGHALYTLDAAAGIPRWRFATTGDVVGAPVAAGGRLHFGSKDHCLYTVDAANGQLRWKLETGGAITGTPVVRDGMVFACSKDRCVYALDAAKGTGSAQRRP
ncbi:PQQ-binding-like beta-propeller repeat protein [Streptomyces sp. SL13]|uniref:Serine/threonine-protein kinase AfsK n=1 Tax=Streptantibioticus silvisoli TaxID=2705255 RepID=A0AA90H777_9ACTN|nr:PQQ-binding-like beta-propeller repeat protein [Streptantibioticus silvisoli]MDI5971792.1 PQQ-binding-like beta-propeller repeat protein [Streptantibioticus silvisoli]